MKVLLTTLNAKYIHKNLALRWLYVAQKGDHDVSIREFVIKDSLERIANQIVSQAYDVIGFSTYIWNGAQTLELAKRIKQSLPHCRIVLGGPEVTYQYEHYLIDSVDAILLSEGEQTFWQYVNQEEDILGLVTHHYRNTILPKTDIAYLESLPSPYLLDFDLKEMGSRYLYVETSRGCPYRCKYCLASLDNKIRYFSLPYLFHLFDELEKTNVKQIKFLDRTFNADKQRSMQIAQRLLEFRKDVSFQFEIMADTLDDALITLIVHNPDKAKFRFEVGIQSFNQKTLKEVNRYQNKEKLEQNLKTLIEHETIVHADLIAGLPYEDLTSFKQTYQHLFSLKTDEMQVGILKLLHGSALEKQMDQYHIICEKESPYQIICNDWMTKKDIEQVEYVALATEKLWNRNLIRKTLWYVYHNTPLMFDFMSELGNQIAQLPHPYQIHQLFQLVNEHLKDDTAKLLLLNDYYCLFKQRPVRINQDLLNKKEKSQVFAVIVNRKELTQNDVRYAMIDFGIYLSKKCYQVLIYNSDQNYPTRYFVSLDLRYLGKEKVR